MVAICERACGSGTEDHRNSRNSRNSALCLNPVVFRDRNARHHSRCHIPKGQRRDVEVQTQAVGKDGEGRESIIYPSFPYPQHLTAQGLPEAPLKSSTVLVSSVVTEKAELPPGMMHSIWMTSVEWANVRHWHDGGTSSITASNICCSRLPTKGSPCMWSLIPRVVWAVELM